MCVIVAKHFKGTGWVLAKNRDQDYVATLKFIDKPDPKVGEIFVLDDQQIKYKEGMNHKGLTIITTSLTPLISIESNKSDGDNIYKALHMTDPEEAAKFLISKKMTGYIFCATPDKLVLVEAAKKEKNGKQGIGEYVSTMRVMPKDDIVVRTNHGVDLPWAGFQMGFDDQQDLWRKSSESRMKIAEKVSQKAKNAEEMLNALAEWVDKDIQMNVFRIENNPRQMRTIFQWALVPKTSTVYIRPIQTKMDLKVTKEMIKAVVVDNQIIKKTYDGRIKHFSKIKKEDGGKEIRTIQTEGFRSFRDFIK
jgi:hypothetical protein